MKHSNCPAAGKQFSMDDAGRARGNEAAGSGIIPGLSF
jgi:hypothetical protein